MDCSGVERAMGKRGDPHADHDELLSLKHQAGRGVPNLQWALGNAIQVLWDDREFERLVSIAVTHGFGDGRRMVVFGLSKSTRPAAVSALLSVFEQPEVTKLATDALIKLGAEAARPALLELLNDPRDWVSRSAARALRTIG